MDSNFQDVQLFLDFIMWLLPMYNQNSDLHKVVHKL